MTIIAVSQTLKMKLTYSEDIGFNYSRKSVIRSNASPRDNRIHNMKYASTPIIIKPLLLELLPGKDTPFLHIICTGL